MSDELGGILPATAVLGAAALVALLLTLARGWADQSRTQLRGAARIAILAILFQAAHFAEELSTGFHARFPALLGLAPMPLRFFVSFNLAWLAIWSLCVWGPAARSRAALFPLWFLGIASLLNGVAHPTLSALTGGYFPGLVTSPVVGVRGVLLVRRLLLVTRSVALSPGAARG